MTEGSAPSPSAVRCSALTKDHGGGRGVFDLDLTVDPGEVFGFIGLAGGGLLLLTLLALAGGVVAPRLAKRHPKVV